MQFQLDFLKCTLLPYHSQDLDGSSMLSCEPELHQHQLSLRSQFAEPVCCLLNLFAAFMGTCLVAKKAMANQGFSLMRTVCISTISPSAPRALPALPRLHILDNQSVLHYSA